MIPFYITTFARKPRLLKFGTELKWIKSTTKSSIELDMTNCGVSMTIFRSGPNFSPIELKFGTGVNF